VKIKREWRYKTSIPDLETRRKGELSFTLQPLDLRGKEPHTPAE
jgi:hypothetical protein